MVAYTKPAKAERTVEQTPSSWSSFLGFGEEKIPEKQLENFCVQFHEQGLCAPSHTALTPEQIQMSYDAVIQHYEAVMRTLYQCGRDQVPLTVGTIL